MMRTSLLKFSICIQLWLVAGLSSVVASSQTDSTIIDLPLELDNNFENGELQPWVEESQASARWKIEDKSSPWETKNPSPQPPNGQSYLRVNRGASLSFGVAILRSPTFKLFPNENYEFSFSFWVRSKWPQFTNLELYLAENGNEKLLLSLYNYSDISNLAWQTKSVSLTGDPISTLSLVFYAYCGTDIEDAVAIDDIKLITSSLQSTTSLPDATDVTTEMITTTAIPSKETPTTSRTFSTTSPHMELTSTSSTSTSTPTTTSTTTPTTTSTTTPTTTSTTTPTTTPTTTSTTRKLTSFTNSETDSSFVTTTEESTTILVMVCDTVTTLSTFFSCPNNLESNYPDPNEPCSRNYYQCLDCVATEQKCNKNQVFSNQTQSCRPCVQVPSCIDECRDTF